MNVAINTHVIGKPKVKSHHIDLTFKCENLDVTSKELADLVKHGYSFCSQHKNNHRKTANFLQAGFIAVDIDKGMTIDDALTDPFVQQYCSFIYTTENHTPEFNRFRIVFELENPITGSPVMRNALTGIIHKFGGDVTCKDATRLFYGSKDCEIHWIGNTLTDDVLKDIITIGEESNSRKNHHENAGDNTTTTVQSRAVIDPETLVKIKDGSSQRIVDIPPHTKVHCPIHVPDKNASAFTFRSNSGVPGIHCSTCGKSYFTSMNVPAYDFNYGLSNLNDINKEDIVITEENEYFVYQDLAIKRFNEPYLTHTETATPLVLVKSPKGTGKTEWLTHIVNICKKNNQSVLLIGHRRSLIASVAHRLSLTSYLNPAYYNKDTKHLREEEYIQPTKYYAICADSLSTLLKPEYHKYDVVLIDEVEQVFSHLTSSTLKSRRNDTFQYFKHYVDVAKKVYVMDADLNFLTVETIHDFVKDKQQEVTFLINDFTSKSRSLDMYGSDDHLLKSLIDSINNNERIFVCTNSKKKVKALTKYLDEKYGKTKKALGITSENSQDSDIQNFIQNIKKEILEYDVVLVSPSVGTGVDITFPDNAQEIDCVYGFFEARVNTHFDIDQQLSRVRHPKSIRIWISPEQFRFETEPEVIKREVALTDRSARKLLHIEVDGTQIYDEPNIEYLNLYSNVKSLQRGSKNHLKKQFIQMKEHYGWTINQIELDQKKSKEGQEVSNIAKEMQELERINSLMSAPIIDSDDYTSLLNAKDKVPITDFHKFSMRRYEIESFYYTDISEDLIKTDKDGKLRTQIREYQNYVNHDSNLMVMDSSEIRHLNPHITDKRTLLSRKKFFQELFERAGLSDSTTPFITNKPIHKDDLKECIKYIKKNNTMIQRWFDVDLRKDIDTKPVQQLGVFLKLLGISWSRSTKKRPDGGKDYYYHIPQERIDYLDDIVDLRVDSQYTEEWHIDRSNIEDNRLFGPDEDTWYMITQQIRTQKINPDNMSDSW